MNDSLALADELCKHYHGETFACGDCRRFADGGLDVPSESSYDLGRADGYEDGKDAGYDDGYQEGDLNGYDRGYDEGYEAAEDAS